MPLLPEYQNDGNQNKIPILILLATVGYYLIGRYKKNAM